MFKALSLLCAAREKLRQYSRTRQYRMALWHTCYNVCIIRYGVFRILWRVTSLIRLASTFADHPATKALRSDCSTVHHLDQCHKTMLGPDQLREYLEHVQLSGEALRPSLATLVTTHRQHAKRIPFSNITIAQGPTLLKELKFPHDIPDISPDGLIKKLLRQKW